MKWTQPASTLASLLVLGASTAAAASPETIRVSVGSDGRQAYNDSFDPSVSSDGNLVAFQSRSKLVAGDSNRDSDVFLRDLTNGRTTRVSLRSGGGQANEGSFNAALSATGRYVAFDSEATNLIGLDANTLSDVFVRDRAKNTTKRVSVPSEPGEGNSDSYDPSISATGRFVAFWSYASNLVGGDSNARADVFVRDRRNNTTKRASVGTATQANGGSYSPSISGDARFVAFDSYASNLVVGDRNAAYDVFVRDTVLNTTIRVSVRSDGGEANSRSFDPALSADGRYVAFWSRASNLVDSDTNGDADVFLHDLSTGTTTRVSVASGGGQARGASFDPAISADGRFVTFWSYASNLVPDDTNARPDVFVHDVTTAETSLVSMAADGTLGSSSSFAPAIAGDGSVIAFESNAALVAGDTNDRRDIFVRRGWM